MRAGIHAHVFFASSELLIKDYISKLWLSYLANSRFELYKSCGVNEF
jgi:hypothetical protein